MPNPDLNKKSMPGKKRALVDDHPTAKKSKKPKLSNNSNVNHVDLSSEVDFPRGGGTTFNPLEVKAIRAEAVKEANEELFEDAQHKIAKKKRPKFDSTQGEKNRIRIEHLNYKRLVVGMKILGQIITVQPLALIVSLPCQLFAHVPITQISSQLTTLLESMEEDVDGESYDEDEDDDEFKTRPPSLSELFHPGQYIRAIVTAVHPPGTINATGIAKARDEASKASRRVELSLVPGCVNVDVHKADLRPGFTLSAAVKSIEDHGYLLDLGIPDISGFLSFDDATKGPFDEKAKLNIGQLLDVSIKAMATNRRTCTVTIDSETFSSSSLSEVTNVTSILPGTLVRSLVTAVHRTGVNLQILGYFDGTVDEFHLPPNTSYTIGKKLKARVLYHFSSSPPRFALSLAKHVLGLRLRRVGDETSFNIQEAYPIGTSLECAKVLKTEQERGLVVEVLPGLEGFVHISQISDDHVPSLSSSSGPWKTGTIHRARVTGYFHLDGLLRLSFKQSVLEQKYMQLEAVQVGELIRGTIKMLTDTAMFVSISGHIDGVVRPNHYADIPLKHPSKRFKPGGKITCRVLAVDLEHKRILLTAKKTLLESSLPILSRFEDAEVGIVTHAFVLKVLEKNLIVGLYNGLKATIPARETSESSSTNLSDSFVVGKVVQVRIISTDSANSHIVASIRQAGSNFHMVTNIGGVEIGDTVEGIVSEIHKEHVLLILQPTAVRALISFKNMANHHSTSPTELRESLKEGAKLEGLIVVSRNPEKGFVFVAHKPRVKIPLTAKGSLSMSTVALGQMVGGRVISHTRNGAYVKLSTRLGGTLHPTDTCDNYETGTPFPAIDFILKAAVIGIDNDKRQLVLSTRHSRMYPDQHKPVTDRDIESVADLKVGDTIRGFIKNIAEHGLFVTLGRDVDARVQIKELFDEYVKDWKGRFEIHQLVKGRVISVDAEHNKVEMTFRSGDLTRNAAFSTTLADLYEGLKVDARVKKIEDYGLFLEISGTKISGLCHKSELSDNKDADVAFALRSFREGDLVRTTILSVDTEKRRVSFGLKPSYFTDKEEGNRSRIETPEPEALGVVDDMEESLENADTNASDDESMLSAPSVDGSDASIQIDMDGDLHYPKQLIDHTENQSHTPAPSVMKLQGGFRWSGNDVQSDAESVPNYSSDEETEQSKKGKKRRRNEIELDLTADMHTKTPESNADFERLLLGSPNSSYLWLQYMSFQLQLSEVKKAREVGRRALQVINFREEQEKLNVWVALLNLESVYGTEESLQATFKDAARQNDSKTVHLRLAFIFHQAEKYERAEEQYKRTSKKFGQSSKVWTLFGEHYYRKGDMEQARKLLPRSLQSLEKRKHLKTISKFAQLEYKLGDPERGKTIFEGIVDSHPKRWDLWSIYIDMESGRRDIQSVRNIFDRVLALKMTSHKAKSFFKKWLALERRLGDEEGATVVKEKATEWTQRAVNP